jgi:hypothetical protein
VRAAAHFTPGYSFFLLVAKPEHSRSTLRAIPTREAAL